MNNIFNCFGQTVLNDPHWNLVWEDNFNNFDSNKWLRVNYGQHGEAQIFMEDNVTVENGNLVITIDDNHVYCPQNPPTVWGACWPCENKWYYYSSGWAETQPAFAIKYGLIQARIKFPYGYGFWPAFWTFVAGGLPSQTNATEIDIVELLGHLPPNVITTNIHTVYGNEPDNYEECNAVDYANSYHNYAIAWSPSKIVWYIDGNPIRILNNHQIVDPVRLILGIGLEPDYPPNSSTPFPSKVYVDYVKVHQLQNDCNNSVSNCSFNFNSIDYRVKRDIKIGGTGCSNSVPSAKNVYLRATNSFTIEGSFTVPLGSTFFVDVNACH